MQSIKINLFVYILNEEQYNYYLVSAVDKKIKDEAIIFNKVNFSYHPNGFSLRDIDIYLRPGECLGVRGLNGSGKTTVGKLAVGILKPQGGEVCIDSRNTESMTLAEIGSQVGYLFQNPAKQLFARTVRKEISLIPVLKGLPSDWIEDKTSQLLDQFDLRKIENSLTLQLSYGEKQRLALAAVMLGEPKYLILDEPTTGLDERRKHQLGETLIHLKRNGTGIMLISHDADFMAKFCDRDTQLINGYICENQEQ